jgi:hypothetical protein
MDYRKLDAALASALAQAPPGARLAVFIEVERQVVTDREADRLRDLGAAAAGAGLFRAELEAGSLGELSEWPWVRSLRLSRRLRLAGGPAHPGGPAAPGDPGGTAAPDGTW